MTRIAIPNRRQCEVVYEWRADAYQSWLLCISMMALACGARRFETCWEMYFLEQRGLIP